MTIWRSQLLWIHNCLNCRKIINDHHLKTPKDFKEVIVNLLVYDDFAKDQYLVKLNWSAIYFSHLHGKLYTDSTNQSLISCSIRTWTSLKSRNLEKTFSKFCNISSIVLYILIFWFPLFKARKDRKILLWLYFHFLMPVLCVYLKYSTDYLSLVYNFSQWNFQQKDWSDSSLSPNFLILTSQLNDSFVAVFASQNNCYGKTVDSKSSISFSISWLHQF